VLNFKGYDKTIENLKSLSDISLVLEFNGCMLSNLNFNSHFVQDSTNLHYLYKNLH